MSQCVPIGCLPSGIKVSFIVVIDEKSGVRILLGTCMVVCIVKPCYKTIKKNSQCTKVELWENENSQFHIEK